MKINAKAKHKIALTSVLVALVISAFLANYIFAFDNLPQTSLTFTKSYRTVSVSWTPVTGAKLYAVYSADDANGTNARRIAVVDTPSFNDTLLKPGSGRSYAVQSGTGRDGLESVDMSQLIWSSVQQVPTTGVQVAAGQDPVLSPHKGSGYVSNSKDGCTRCHITHDANNHTLIVSSGTSSHTNAAVAICADCHEQNTSAEKPFVESLFAGSGSKSGHLVDSTTIHDGKIECVTCHGPHQDSSVTDNSLKAKSVKKFGSLTSDIFVDAARPNNQCTSCHDDAQTWYTATNTTPYPNSRVLASGADVPEGYAEYPESGTYPGATVSNDTTKNAHARIAASDGYNKGDCRYCHSSHASSAPYDALLTERGELRAMKGSTPADIQAERISGAYASFCLSCHNGNNKGTAWAGAANIADTVSLPVGSLDTSRTSFLASSAGHVVRSANASIPEGSAMPCYTCHDTHGNAAGNLKNLSASLATGLTTTAKLERELCLACHATSDGKILNATATGYVNVGTQKVLGLSRAGMDTPSGGGAAVKNKLKIVEGLTEHTAASTQSCTTCHGNVHNPGITNTEDGKLCIQCHADDFPAAAGFEFTHSGSPEAVGWETGYNPHLIPSFSQSMGMGFFPEKILKGEASPIIPLPEINAQKGPYCSGCHAWHSSKVGDIAGLEPGKTNGLTLRSSYNSPGSASTDYIHTASPSKLGGLCLSCHNDYLGTSGVGAPTKGPLNPLNDLDSEKYFGKNEDEKSAHNYSIPVTRKAASQDQISTIDKTFNANCTKCHNSADAIFQPLENANKLQLFGHYTEGRRLLARFGIIAEIAKPSTNINPDIKRAQDFNNTGMCFGCHARKGEIAGNAGKQYSGKDWYGIKPIRSANSTTWKNASGVTIGTQNFNSEAVFDDMYVLNNKPLGGFAPGDGLKGSADAAAKAALSAGLEVSGHQVNAVFDVNRVNPGQGGFVLNDYVRTNLTAIRCSDCHNVHAVTNGVMADNSEWPTTKKGLAGRAGWVVGAGFPAVPDGVATAGAVDNTTPKAAVAADGSRLITLNDYFAREEYRPGAKAAIIAWLQTPAGGPLSLAAANTKYAEMEYRGITKEDIDKTAASAAIKTNWPKTVEIFCFRCHSAASMANRSHVGGGLQSHQKKALACVHCHVPTMHGGKMPLMLGDLEAVPDTAKYPSNPGNVAIGHVPMQPHQIFRWTNYSTSALSAANESAPRNMPIIKLNRIDMTVINSGGSANKRTCSTTCHTSGNSTGVNWNTAD